MDKRDLPEWMYDTVIPVNDVKNRYLRWTTFLNLREGEINPTENKLRDMVTELRVILHLLPPALLDVVPLWVNRERACRGQNKTGPWNR